MKLLREYALVVVLLLLGITSVIVGLIRKWDLVMERLRAQIDIMSDPFMLAGVIMIVLAVFVVYAKE